jgi:hypothetical protein
MLQVPVIAWNPYYLNEAGNTQSCLAINNSSTLTLTAIENTNGYAVIATPFNMGVGVYGNYRLVSASIQVIPQTSLQTASGKIAGGIVMSPNFPPQTVAASGFFFASGAYTVSSNLDNALYYEDANITMQESIRHIYFPFDNTFEQYTGINSSHDATEGGENDFCFVYYITGTAASASFNLELYCNFEAIPTITGLGYIQTTLCKCIERDTEVVKTIAENPQIVSQASANVNEHIMKYESENWLNRTFDYIMDHTDDVMNIGSKILNLASSF